jgi:hypothetical protein
METNTSYVKNEPTVGMNFFENIPPVGKENDAIQWGDPIGLLKTTIRATNKETVKGLSLSTILTEQNRAFLEERCNEGTMDDLVSLIRGVWDNYHVGKLITLVEQSTQAFQESPGANLQNLQGIDQPTKKAHGGYSQ